MRVTYLISWDVDGRVVEHVFEEGYTGPVAALGKDDSRSNADKATDALLEQQKVEAATKAGQISKLEPEITQHETTAPGQLSPYAKAQYDADTRNIHDSYDKLKQVGMKQIAQHGMSRAPSGMLASVINTNDRNEGAQETAAYEAAIQRQYQEEQDAANKRLAIAGLAQPVQASSAAAGAAGTRFGMGTIGGDISSGLASGLSTIDRARDVFRV